MDRTRHNGTRLDVACLVCGDLLDRAQPDHRCDRCRNYDAVLALALGMLEHEDQAAA